MLTALLLLQLALAATPAARSQQPPSCSDQRPHFAYNGSRVGKVIDNLAEHADCCALCTKDLRCRQWTWHPLGTKGQPTFCEMQANDGAFVPVRPRFVAGSVSASKTVCTTDLDCTLAGECIDGQCHCDGWTHGLRCEVLNLEPVDPGRPGYRNASGFNSWGGASIFDEQTKKWFLFASQIQGRCALSGFWSTYSQAVRLHSDGPTGPWTFDAVVVHSEAHNVEPLCCQPDTLAMAAQFMRTCQAAPSFQLVGSGRPPRLIPRGCDLPPPPGEAISLARGRMADFLCAPAPASLPCRPIAPHNDAYASAVAVCSGVHTATAWEATAWEAVADGCRPRIIFFCPGRGRAPRPPSC